MYTDPYYRQWVNEIALSMYEGRQDNFVWLDLVKQFRQPEKNQIIPVNITREIIDETSILYKETPIYRVVDRDTGKHLPKDQKLWEDIQEHSRYNMTMDKVDRWCRLLGTTLLKVSFVDPDTGSAVKKNQGGKVQLDVMHSGVYDVKYGHSPYFMTDLMIGLDSSFGGYANYIPGQSSGTVRPSENLDPSSYGVMDISRKNKSKGKPKKFEVTKVNKITWSLDTHVQVDENNNELSVDNPYGVIPAVPFFNQDPAHHFFLPVNEPLLYANHAMNMRMTDLNHIAKFQSFGVPVISGVERPTGVRQGRPADDFNQLRGGLAQSRFGGLAGSALGAGGAFRNFDGGFGVWGRGDADSNALGFSLGPDTAVSVGQDGDFKFASPNADITGLISTIESINDIIRVNHGLRPKHKDQQSASGFALWLEKSGVIDENRRRSQIFKEREQQLFEVITKLWNTHYSKSGEKKFSDNAKLEINYVEPKFPVDPKTQIETIIMENQVLDTGDRASYKKLYPWMPDTEINKMIKSRRSDKEETSMFEADMGIKVALSYEAAGIPMPGEKPAQKDDKKPTKSKIDNKAKHSEDSSKQKGKSGDNRE